MRCFIAVSCSQDVLQRLLDFQRLLAGVKGLKLVDAGNVHLTLKFLGEVEEDVVKQISRELSFLETESRFNVDVHGVGVFPSLSRPSVVWAGLKDGGRVSELHHAIELRIKGYCFQPEARFHPHFTLARVKFLENRESLAKIVFDGKERDFGSCTINSVKLMSSTLTPSGPVYSSVREYRLA
jgi:2'-5' RNA ligase